MDKRNLARLLIITPLLPPQSGGPAYYAVGLKTELEHLGQAVNMIAFSDVLKYFSGLRHLIFLCKVFNKLRHANVAIALDTVSVALPTVIAARILQKKVIIRVGGDFVWEHYVERTKEKVQLSAFYSKHRRLSFKERMVMTIQKRIVLPLADVIVFSTKWQKEIWHTPYTLSNKRTEVIENAYQVNLGASRHIDTSNNIIWIGRNLILKNVEILDKAMEEVQIKVPKVVYIKHSNLSREQVVTALSHARALVIPSLSEVSPNIVLEALSLSVPVLLTKDCGLYETLQSAVIWIDPNDSTDIASRIQTIMTNEGLDYAQEKARSFKSARTYVQVAQDFLVLCT